ncbi:MAG: response regulator [Rhodospirillales bacterium]|uniref:Response regulator rcp1 n=2 Tax=root TaxID=1 RepID=A0A564W9S0_9PROT|nr:response regulator [Rhodospirillales bacterium]SUS05067.1 Response regulator rcp1 [uncultured Defluviicoccus sp.]VUX45005.1 Response regulator rcp1 [Candidatus Defluviicoccus seviourii]
MTMRPTKPISIVVAEDDPDDRFLIKEAFEQHRLSNDVAFVEDGEELIAYLRREGQYAALEGKPFPGLILLDLNMPRMDGREALQIIKSDKFLCRIPVVVLTTSKAEEDILRTYGLGVNSFITKPVSFDDLVRIVQTLCNYWIEIVVLPPECQSVKVEV